MDMQKEDGLKETIRKKYGSIALYGNAGSCCMPTYSSSSTECCSSVKDVGESARSIGYEPEDLASIPPSSVLGVGCGNPAEFAEISEGDTVVDLGSGAGIDVFLAANVVKDSGWVIGVDMTEEMIQKARENALKHGYRNVEFRMGDIEKRIPVDDNSADLVISNCVINLTSDKVKAFREVYRILKLGVGRMVISDLVTSREVEEGSLDVQRWCSCIDGALTKENYMDSIRKAGFDKIEVMDERPYTEMDGGDTGKNKDGGRIITSIAIRATKG